MGGALDSRWCQVYLVGYSVDLQLYMYNTCIQEWTGALVAILFALGFTVRILALWILDIFVYIFLMTKRITSKAFLAVYHVLLSIFKVTCKNAHQNYSYWLVTCKRQRLHSSCMVTKKYTKNIKCSQFECPHCKTWIRVFVLWIIWQCVNLSMVTGYLQ